MDPVLINYCVTRLGFPWKTNQICMLFCFQLDNPETENPNVWSRLVFESIEEVHELIVTISSSGSPELKDLVFVACWEEGKHTSHNTLSV